MLTSWWSPRSDGYCVLIGWLVSRGAGPVFWLVCLYHVDLDILFWLVCLYHVVLDILFWLVCLYHVVLDILFWLVGWYHVVLARCSDWFACITWCWILCSDWLACITWCWPCFLISNGLCRSKLEKSEKKYVNLQHTHESNLCCSELLIISDKVLHDIPDNHITCWSGIRTIRFSENIYQNSQ